MKEEHDENMFGPEDSWPGAKQELDRHFRTKRFVFWMTSLSIAGILILGTWFLSRNNNTSQTVEKSTSTESAQPTVSSRTQTEITPDAGSTPRVQTSGTSEDSKTANHSSSPSANNFSQTNSNGSNSVKNHESPVQQKSKLQSEESSVTLLSSELKAQPVIHSTESKFNAGEPKEISTDISVSENSKTSLLGQDPGNMMTFQEQAKTSPLALIVPLAGKPLVTNATSLMIVSNQGSILPEPKSSTHVEWSANIYGGAHYLWKDIHNAPVKWMNRRNEEEKNIVLPSMGASLAAAIKSFSFSIGVEYSTWGEKADYSPRSWQEEIQQRGNWQTYLYSAVDTDTAYFSGNQYFLQNTVQRMDSNYITIVDTLYGEKYDASIVAANGINRYWYVEVPVELSYKHSFGKLGLGASAGISPAWLVSKKGNYLKQNMEGVETIQSAGATNAMIVNGRLSLDVYYAILPRLNIVLRPQVKGNLQSVFSSDSGFEQKYKGAGILFGINYKLN